MIRVDPSHWTADFRIARALAEAYKATGLDDAVFFCVGEPTDPIGALGPTVGDEIIKYYPHVVGTGSAPVVEENLLERAEEMVAKWPQACAVAIEAGAGAVDQLGSVEITDRGLTIQPSAGRLPLDLPDVTVNIVLRIDQRGRLSRRRAPGRSTQGLKEAEREIGSDDGGVGTRLKKFRPLREDEITPLVVQRLTDTVIDGILRFLSKIGKQRL